MGKYIKTDQAIQPAGQIFYFYYLTSDSVGNIYQESHIKAEMCAPHLSDKSSSSGMPVHSHLCSLVWIGLFALPVVLSNDVVKIEPLITDCAGGALDAIGLVSFSDYPESSAYYTAYCASEYWKTSIAITVDTYCSGEEITKGWALLQGYCENYGLLTIEDIDVLVAMVDMNNVRTVDVFQTKGEVFNDTILVDKYSWSMGAKTEVFLLSPLHLYLVTNLYI